MAYAAEKKQTETVHAVLIAGFIGNLNKIIQIAAINTHTEFKGWRDLAQNTRVESALLQRNNLHKSSASKGSLASCSAKIISTVKLRSLKRMPINSKHCLLFISSV